MEAEKFILSKRTIKYGCGCEREIFGFEQTTPSNLCEQHGKPIISEYNMVDEL